MACVGSQTFVMVPNFIGNRIIRVCGQTRREKPGVFGTHYPARPRWQGRWVRPPMKGYHNSYRRPSNVANDIAGRQADSVLEIPESFTRHTTGMEVAEKLGVSLTGKTGLITGVTSKGIGRETARVLGTMGMNLLIPARSVRGAKSAATDLNELILSTYHGLPASRRVAPIPGECIAVDAPLELLSLESVHKFSVAVHRYLLQEGRPLDLLVANAGIGLVPGKRVTDDGLEIHMGINHFAHFILINALLDDMRRSADGRIIVVSSELHRGQNCSSAIDFDDMLLRKVPDEALPDSDVSHAGLVGYCRSKLANLLYVRQLDKMLRVEPEGSTVSVFAVCPGFVPETELARYVPQVPESEAMFKAACANPELKSIEAGAATQILVAAAPNMRRWSGRYFSDCHVAQPSEAALDDKAADKLWKLSDAISKMTKPRTRAHF
eukprot:jgi/Mesvir1/23589/Mv18279-RA.1